MLSHKRHIAKVIQLLAIALMLCSTTANAQKKWSLTGRVEEMPVVIYNATPLQQLAQNNENPNFYAELNNRLDFKWYPSTKWTFEVGLKNNIVGGPMLSDINNSQNGAYNKSLTQQQGLFDFTMKWFGGDSYLFYSNIDRLFATYTNNNLILSVGRQRINWGINEVWQPNDIFNSFSYLDFNYPERPGSDAIRLQYYTGATSQIDLAYKMNENHKSTFAAMYKSMLGDYDWQVMAGLMNQEYWVAGLGWSGDISGAGFSGEATYYSRRKDSDLANMGSTQGTANVRKRQTLLATISANYTFPSNWYVSGSLLLNSAGSKEANPSNLLMNSGNITALDYTQSLMQCFAQVSYPISPLLKSSFSLIINPFDGSSYLSPSIEYSISDDVSFLLLSQLFAGNKTSEYGSYGQWVFARLSIHFAR